MHLPLLFFSELDLTEDQMSALQLSLLSLSEGQTVMPADLTHALSTVVHDAPPVAAGLHYICCGIRRRALSRGRYSLLDVVQGAAGGGGFVAAIPPIGFSKN